MPVPNGFTFMTDEEKKIIGTIKDNPTNILKLSGCPSQEFVLMAVFLCPGILRYVHNQSHWARLLAVTLDKSASKYVNGMTPEIRQAADSKSKRTIMNLNMPHYLIEIHANAYNLRVCGLTTLNPGLVR